MTAALSLLLLAAAAASALERAPAAKHAVTHGRPAAVPPGAGPPAAPEPWDSEPLAADPAAIARAAAAATAGNREQTIVLLFSQRLVFDAQGHSTFTRHLVYRLGEAASADPSWSQIAATWLPWRHERPLLRARVISPDGAVHLLDPATLADESAPREDDDLFGDVRILRGPLPAIASGAIVEEEITLRNIGPLFGGGVATHLPMQQHAPVRHARLLLDAPADQPLHHLSWGLPSGASRAESSQGRQRVLYEYHDLPEADPPVAGLPPDVPRYSGVLFSTAASWAAVARGYGEVVEGVMRGADLSDLLRAAGLAEHEAGSQLEAMERVLARLREIRYAGVETGQGGLVPRRPSETLRRGFGDCKDKAVLLVAALRALDIPAYVALLHSGPGEDAEPSLPGLGWFNHMLVMVPGSPAVWIDPTSRFSRAGELPAADQGRRALVISPSATALIGTPESEAAANRVTETVEFLLAPHGPARVVNSEERLGEPERSARQAFASLSREQLDKIVAHQAEAAWGSKAPSGFTHTDPNDLSRPFRTRLEVATAPKISTLDEGAAISVSPAELFRYLPEPLQPKPPGKQGKTQAEVPPPRKLDFVFSQSGRYESSFRIVPPAGFQAPAPLPAARVRSLGSLSLSEEFAAGAGEVVTATFVLDTGKRRLTPQELEAARIAIAAAAVETPVLLRFEQLGEKLLAAGDVRGALAEFRREAAAAPGQAMPHLRKARALLAGGLGEAARGEADAALRLEPKLAVAHRTAGWLLEHDRAGRRFGPGWDRPGAIAAYRKAKQLDPEDVLARASLAIVLERDERGERYASADLDQAIAEYRQLREELKSEAWDDNLLACLVAAGRFDEALQLARPLETTPLRQRLELVATAATEGADAALALAQRRISGGEQQAAALAEVAQELIKLRRYPVAADLLSRAAGQVSGAARLLETAAIVRRARRLEELQLPAEDPASLFSRLVQLGAARSVDKQAMARLLSRDAAAEADAIAELKSLKTTAPWALDLGLAAGRSVVAGDGSVGFRVRLSAGTGEEQATTYYVVREDGQLRIADLGSNPYLLGARTQRLLATGDLRAARQWLDWAREAEPEASGEDPLARRPLRVLWPEAGGGGEAEIRCAAAALQAEGPKSVEALPILATCRERAEDDAHRAALDLAAAAVYSSQKRYGDLLTTARRLTTMVPESRRAWDLEFLALRRQGLWDDLRGAARRRQQHAADDSMAVRVLAEVAVAEGKAADFDTATALLRRLAVSGKAEGVDYNNLAWYALCRGRVDEQAVADAQRAADLSGYKNAAHLHTLAAIYAEAGKGSEAYRVLVQAMEARPERQIANHDWWVLGRLADQYGEPAAARVLYQRVSPPAADEVANTSTYMLARRRLAALDEAARQPLRPGGR